MKLFLLAIAIVIVLLIATLFILKQMKGRRILNAEPMIPQRHAFGFSEWAGENYIRLHRVWIGRYADQRKRENWKSTKELYQIYLKSVS